MPILKKMFSPQERLSKDNQGIKIKYQQEQRKRYQEMRLLKKTQPQIKLLLQEEKGQKGRYKQRHRVINPCRTLYCKRLQKRM